MKRDHIEKVYAEESGKMLSFIRKQINRQIDIYDEMDILQETFFSLIDGIDVTRPIDNLSAYIYQSIRNKVIDHYRKRKIDKDDSISVDDIAIDELVSEQLEREEEMEGIWQALEQLPDQQKNVFIQTEFEEKTFKEISSETGISINTLLSQKQYAIKKLKAILTEL